MFNYFLGRSHLQQSARESSKEKVVNKYNDSESKKNSVAFTEFSTNEQYSDQISPNMKSKEKFGSGKNKAVNDSLNTKCNDYPRKPYKHRDVDDIRHKFKEMHTKETGIIIINLVI